MDHSQYAKLIKAAFAENRYSDVVDLYSKMLKNKVAPSKEILNIVLNSYDKLGDTENKEIIRAVLENRRVPPEVRQHVEKIRSHAETGLASAFGLFFEMIRQGYNPPPEAWSIVIELAWQRQDHWAALKIEKAMEKLHYRPTLDEQVMLDKLRIEGNEMYIASQYPKSPLYNVKTLFPGIPNRWYPRSPFAKK